MCEYALTLMVYQRAERGRQYPSNCLVDVESQLLLPEGLLQCGPVCTVLLDSIDVQNVMGDRLYHLHFASMAAEHNTTCA